MRTKKWEQGSSPATMLMLIGGALALAVPVFMCGHVLLTLSRSQAAVDQAALDAADAASGLIAGYPCQLADDVAREHRIALTGCNVEKLVSRVTMTTTIYGFQVETRAQAGPKNHVDD